MSRLFDDLSSEYASIGSVVVSAVPLAMVAWIYPDAILGNQTIMTIADGADVGDLFTIGARTGDINATSRAGGTSSTAGSGAGPSVDTWHHACGIFATATDRRSFIDGGNKGTNATSSTPTVDSATIIGQNGLAWTVAQGYFTGRIAEAAIYDLSVWPGASDTARADNFEATACPALAAGVLPIQIPLGLVGYWPLHGNDAKAIDLHPRSQDANDYSMTLSGTAKAKHAPVNLFTRTARLSVPLIEVAAVGGRIMGSLAGQGGLAGAGGIAGTGGGIAG